MEHPNKAYFEAVAKAIPASQYTQYNVASMLLEERISADRQANKSQTREDR